MPSQNRRNNLASVIAPIDPVQIPSRKSRSRTNKPLGVVEQVRAALHPRARLATLLGALLGGFVPVASYVIAHQEIPQADGLRLATLILLAAGGLLFSAKSVYGWSKLAFQSGGKSLGFCTLVEGVMIISKTPWLALAALGVLISINAISAGCTLSRKPNSNG